MHYTVLNIAEIRDLMSQYGIGEIDSHKILSGGSENTNYLVSSKRSQYVLTICEQKSVIEATNLALLLEHLATNEFVTSKIIRTNKKKAIIIYNGKPVILKSFLEGKTMNNLPIHLITLIGNQLGRLHKIKAPDYIPKKLNYGIEHFREVAIYAKNASFHKWLQKMEDQIKSYISSAIPQALIHSDVFYSNVIIKNDESIVTIMDFEEATYYYKIFDIGMAIVGLCSEGETINLEKVSNFLKGYKEEVELTELEQNALQVFTIYAAASMSFWRHKNFNFTNPTPSMKNHFLELKNIADYINDLPQNCFKQMLNID